MRTLTRTAVAVLGSAALGLGVMAAPAVAAPGDPATLELGQTTYSAGDWGDGVEFTVTDVPEEATGVTLAVGANGENSGGLLAEPVEATEGPDGTFTGTVVPDDEVGPIAPGEAGFPQYYATAVYTYVDEDDEEQSVPTSIELTIVPDPSISGPSEATVAELREGVDLALAGYPSNATAEGVTEVRTADGWEPIDEFEAPLDETGRGEGALTVTGVAAGAELRVVVSTSDDVSATIGITVAGGGTAAPSAPVRPTRVDTGA